MSLKGFRIDFSAEGAAIDFDSQHEGFDTTVQNAVVNVGQRKGSDAVFPLRGISLYQQALSGAIVDESSASHYTNFASLDTLLFSQQTELDGNEEDSLVGFALTVTGFVPGIKMELDVNGKSQGGRSTFSSAVL